VDPELAAAFAALEVALARPPNETIGALARRLTASPALVSAFDVLERSLYAATPPSSPECREAAATMRAASSHGDRP
jgi:uncharacterized transporter YbjL